MKNIFKKVSNKVKGETRQEWEARMDKLVAEIKVKDEEHIRLDKEFKEKYAEYQETIRKYNEFMAENYPKAIIELIEENRDRQLNAIDETMKYFK